MPHGESAASTMEGPVQSLEVGMDSRRRLKAPEAKIPVGPLDVKERPGGVLTTAYRPDVAKINHLFEKSIVF